MGRRIFYVLLLAIATFATRTNGLRMSHMRRNKVQSNDNPAEDTPAEDTVRGIEKVIATTFVKLNRTVVFKQKDDELFEKREKEAKDIVANHNKMVEQAKACIKNEETKANIAEATLQKLLEEKDNLNASIAKLRETTELKKEAQESLVSKMDEWKQGVSDDSAETLAVLKRSSEDLLKTIRERKNGENNDDRLSGIDRPSSSPNKIDIVVSSEVGATDDDENSSPSFLETSEEKSGDGVRSLDDMYERVEGMLKEYVSANGILPENIAKKLEEVSSPSEASDSTHDDLHDLVLTHIEKTQQSIEEALNAQVEAKKAAEGAAQTCRENLANLGPLLAAAKEAVAVTQKKKAASDDYYATQVLHFKQSITFAQDALKSIEVLAEREFAGHDTSLRALKEEIQKTLDLCSKLEGGLIGGADATNSVASDAKSVEQVNVHHAMSRTVAQATAETESHEVLASKTTVSKN